MGIRQDIVGRLPHSFLEVPVRLGRFLDEVSELARDADLGEGGRHGNPQRGIIALRRQRRHPVALELAKTGGRKD